MIEIIVSDIINVQPNKAYEILKDYGAYKNWWSIPTETFNNKMNYFQFNPIPFVSIGLEENFSELNKIIVFNYVKGPFRGQGKWELSNLENSKTKISYTINLKPINLIFGIIANTKLFKWKHKQDITNIIEKIKEKTAENNVYK